MNGKEVEKKFHIDLNVLRATFNVPCKVISESFFFFIHYFQIKQYFKYEQSQNASNGKSSLEAIILIFVLLI
jgi:hypothetical protein